MRRGPKTLYDPVLHPKLVQFMARKGETHEEIAKNLQIASSTLSLWLTKHVELSEALKEGRDFKDLEVENSLLKRALGYEYTETEVTANAAGEVLRRKVIKKTCVPDVTAQIFWLKNRQRERWRDVQHVEQKNIGPADEFSDYTTDELQRIVSEAPGPGGVGEASESG